MSSEVGGRRLGRRAWMASSVTGVAGASVLGAWLGRTDPRFETGRYGRIQRDPAGVLDLLDGFRYRILEREGWPMDDGHPVPSKADGMACFDPGDGTLVLMRNHEIRKHRRAFLTHVADVPEKYDPESDGGVTRLVLDAETLERRSSNLVLAGTNTNCSGGPSPFGWLSCEENVEPNHGFVFLCDPAASSVQPPVKIEAYGRFRHEAAVMRPGDLVCYLSEDRPDGCFYRFTPHDPADPFEGTFEAMVVQGVRDNDTSRLLRGMTFPISWVPVPEQAPAEDVLRLRAREAGAAIVCRGEGVAVDGSDVYVCATAGGVIAAGQILKIVDRGAEGTLEVLASSVHRQQLDMPDNVCLTPAGQLMFVEDGYGYDFLRGVDTTGELFTLGRNASSQGEMAGVCMSPDGRVMFLNLQEEGITLRVEGPFDRFA